MTTSEPTPPPNIQFLTHRARLLADLRRFFDSRGYIEVQPPCLSRDCVVDPYIDPIAVTIATDTSAELPQRMYLQTSPELAMKRMLAAGAPSMYSIVPVFRADEVGAFHNIEFTMLEWYQVGANYQDGIRTLGELASEVLNVDDYETKAYRQAFDEIVGFDPIDVSLETLKEHVASIDKTLAATIDDRDDLLDVLMSEHVQPQLGVDRPTVLCDYPRSQAALAKLAMHDEACASRFELFYKGVELANGYDELTDADELIARTKRSNEKRITSGRPAISVPQSLVRAMRKGLPQCAGVALGVDRLLMLRVGAIDIAQTMPFTSKNA